MSDFKEMNENQQLEWLRKEAKALGYTKEQLTEMVRSIRLKIQNEETEIKH